jgi:putative aldouronate transport system permease protein
MEAIFLATKVKAGATKKRSLQSKNALQLYSLAAIPAFLVFLFSYVPMFGIIIAFKNYRFDKGIFGSEWVGLDNIKVFLASDDFATIARNTVLLNLLFMALGVVAAVLLAVVLYEITSRKAVKTYQTILITPNFLSWVVVGYMAYGILNPSYGLLNQVITKFGGGAIQWYSEPKYWPIILAICSLWKSVGMSSIVYYASLMGIDASLFEAAKIDGANRVQVATKITIPQLVPVIIILQILALGNIFRADFGLFYQIPRDIVDLYPITDVMDTYIFRVMRIYGDMSLSSAAGLLQSVVGFCMVMLTNFVVKFIDPDKSLF